LSDNYIYCFIRKDLDVVHQLIQLGHASYLAGKETLVNGCPSTCLFEVADVKELQEVYRKLSANRLNFELFYEPTTKNRGRTIGFSAICTHPIDAEDAETRQFFQQFRKYE
jgi:hypothetical protein